MFLHSVLELTSTPGMDVVSVRRVYSPTEPHQNVSKEGVRVREERGERGGEREIVLASTIVCYFVIYCFRWYISWTDYVQDVVLGMVGSCQKPVCNSVENATRQ